AQGRHVTAAALPWLRTWEVWVHATDLHGAADFPDFPPPLLDELIVDVLRFRRDAREEALQVRPTDRDITPPFDGQAPPVWIEGRTAALAPLRPARGAPAQSGRESAAFGTRSSTASRPRSSDAPTSW